MATRISDYATPITDESKKRTEEFEKPPKSQAAPDSCPLKGVGPKARRYLDEHYVYEVWMLFEGLRLPKQGVWQNVRVEIVLLHTRNLIEFHFFSDRQRVNASCFDGGSLTKKDDWPKYSTRYPNIGKLYGKINGKLSHFGFARDEKETWYLDDLVLAFHKIASNFLHNIHDGLKTDNVKSFEGELDKKISEIGQFSQT